MRAAAVGACQGLPVSCIDTIYIRQDFVESSRVEYVVFSVAWAVLDSLSPCLRVRVGFHRERCCLRSSTMMLLCSV